MRLRSLLGALCAVVSLAAGAAIPPAEQVTAVEFYNASADHYFMSADSREINDLDTGVHVGWARTGYRFSVIKAKSTYPGTSPMCRFFSQSLNSHFYTAKPAECEDVKVKFAATWLFESAEVFRAFVVDPSTGICPTDTSPVYRLYNNRPDANHRYTDQVSVFNLMKAKGWIPEGDGNPALPVAFCTPSTPPPGPVPQCALSASTQAPFLGSPLTLTATCTNNPTSYDWQECAYDVPTVCNPMPSCSTSATCTVGSVVTAYTRYVVAGINAFGTGPRAELQVEWRNNAPGYTAGFCGQYSRAKRIVIPWGSPERYNTVDYGGFPADMVVVIEVSVPASPPSYATAGYTSLAEFNGVPAYRHMTLSKTPCDFRDPDPTGTNGPFDASAGTAVLIQWNVGAAPVGLVAGQTYFFSVRNLSCGQLTCEATTSTTWPH